MRFLIYPAVILVAIIAVLSTAHAQDWCSIQEKLQASGDYDGAIDCIPGPGTMQAVRSYESRTGKPIYKRDDEDVGEAEAGGKVCKDAEISATSRGRPNQGLGKGNAREQWVADAKAQFGEEWSRVRNARVISDTCWPINEEDWLAIAKWRCRLVAVPCRATAE